MDKVQGVNAAPNSLTEFFADPGVQEAIGQFASSGSMKFIAVGLMALGLAGAAIGVGNIFSSFLNAASRNPSAAQDLQKMAFIGAGLSEAMGLFAFVIAMLLIFGK